MLVIKNYDGFNGRRFSNPWVALVGEDARIDFSAKIGGYTGAWGKGEEGQLYINKPEEGKVYAYGQKDNRGNKGGYEYLKIVNGKMVEIEKSELIENL